MESKTSEKSKTERYQQEILTEKEHLIHTHEIRVNEINVKLVTEK